MTTISEGIIASNKTIKSVGENFLRAIKCSGIAGADFSSIFEVKQDANTQGALAEYHKEKSRVEQEIESLKKSIASAEAIVGDLNAKIRACDNTSYSSAIRTAGNNMDSYKRKMNNATDARAKEDAQVQYRQAQRTKESAEANQRANSRNRAEYAGQKRTAENSLNDQNSQKHNLEKRLTQVIEIINLF